ncbi:unnamed protein product [Linum tenue]|uniref:Uncharacterized protein n=1 Tax=Linum tenue TaxID=586396 RepID=A0AAV0S6F3_9ROSI|nr:unnamed protein product [Linum tenue]
MRSLFCATRKWLLSSSPPRGSSSSTLRIPGNSLSSIAQSFPIFSTRFALP